MLILGRPPQSYIKLKIPNRVERGYKQICVNIAEYI